MKKTNKQKKLIVTIAIILIVVIAIIITTNIISNNNQISNEGYFATTANANSNLVASYIKEGITIGGITGTLKILDTSDATATPEDITKGKTAYVKGQKITGTYVENTLGTVTGNETENSYVNDKYGNQVVVPAGFKVVNPDEDVTKGIIIEDVSAGDENTKESQFVWIPVGDIITDTNGSITTIILGRYTFDTNGVKTLVQSFEEYTNETQLKTSSTDSYLYKELLNTTSSNNEKAKDIKDFIIKTTTSGGYYIGRYEAGDAYATDDARTSDTSDSNPVVCKTGVYSYNYVTQSQASSLSQKMYTSNNFKIDLINSYAWDTAIVFIQTFSGDKNYSKQIGINTKSTPQKCGDSILKSVDNGDKAQDVRCNIYDMAGNTFEWSTETCSNVSLPGVYRGGRYNEDSFCTSDRNTYISPVNSYSNISFRPTLYL